MHAAQAFEQLGFEIPAEIPSANLIQCHDFVAATFADVAIDAARIDAEHEFELPAGTTSVSSPLAGFKRQRSPAYGSTYRTSPAMALTPSLPGWPDNRWGIVSTPTATILPRAASRTTPAAGALLGVTLQGLPASENAVNDTSTPALRHVSDNDEGNGDTGFSAGGTSCTLPAAGTLLGVAPQFISSPSLLSDNGGGAVASPPARPVLISSANQYVESSRLVSDVAMPCKDASRTEFTVALHLPRQEFIKEESGTARLDCAAADNRLFVQGNIDDSEVLKALAMQARLQKFLRVDEVRKFCLNLAATVVKEHLVGSRGEHVVDTYDVLVRLLLQVKDLWKQKVHNRSRYALRKLGFSKYACVFCQDGSKVNRQPPMCEDDLFGHMRNKHASSHRGAADKPSKCDSSHKKLAKKQLLQACMEKAAPERERVAREMRVESKDFAQRYEALQFAMKRQHL